MTKFEYCQEKPKNGTILYIETQLDSHFVSILVKVGKSWYDKPNVTEIISLAGDFSTFIVEWKRLYQMFDE